MKMIMTAIFSLCLLAACSSVRTFDLVGVSGGNIIDRSVVVEDNVIKLKVDNYKTKYDLVTLRFSIFNKGTKFIKLDIQKIYIKNNVGEMKYPLSIEEAFNVVQSNSLYETPREKMRARRQIAMEAINSGEIPPLGTSQGVLFFEPGATDVREIILYIRGLEIDGSLIDLQSITFQDEDYAYDLKKASSAKKAKEELEKKNEEKRKELEKKELEKKELEKKDQQKPVAAPTEALQPPAPATKP